MNKEHCRLCNCELYSKYHQVSGQESNVGEYGLCESCEKALSDELGWVDWYITDDNEIIKNDVELGDFVFAGTIEELKEKWGWVK